MKKLRLTLDEQELMIRSIIDKFNEDCHKNITTFEYTQKDVKDFLEGLTKTTVKKPTLLIDETAYTKMYELVKQSPIELQWHMMVKRDLENNTYTIYDILLFPQTNSGTSTTTDQDEFAKWQSNLIQDMDFPLEELRGHGHSHVNMNVYSSGIDDAYQMDLITKVKDGDYYVFLVLNKRMEMYALIYDFHQQIIFDTDDIDIQIISHDGENIKSWCSEQIKKYCKKHKYSPNKNYCNSYAPSSLKIDNFVPPEDELVMNMKPRKFGRRR